MPTKSYLLGPGILEIGETGTAVDYAAQVEAVRVSWSVDQEDPRPMLSGDDLAGDTTWTASLSATFVQDLSASGLIDYTWTNKGDEVPVRFVPNSEDPAAAKQVEGIVTITPLDIGGDPKKRNTSDVEWTFVGEPTLAAYVAGP